MYSLYFRNSIGKIRLLNTAETKEDCFVMIDKFLNDHSFKSYYKRLWNSEICINEKQLDVTKIDVGSHCEFFYIEPPIKIGVDI